MRQTEDGPSGIFFNSTLTTDDAGFFLAFPNATQTNLTGKVYGFQGHAGPLRLEDYTPLSQAPATGSGTPADPFKQITAYAVAATEGTNLAEVTQTTTYVNGAQDFAVDWAVKNTDAAPLKLKALAAADFYFDGSDQGTGIYTDGPPRFIGGTNADPGNSGGFSEITGGAPASPQWTSYEALAFSSSTGDSVWTKVGNAADDTAATFDNSVLDESVDNAGGVEWDQFLTTPIPAGATQHFRLLARNAVPAALQLTPSNAGAPRGVPTNVTATAVNTDGVPYAGRTVRYTIAPRKQAAKSTADAAKKKRKKKKPIKIKLKASSTLAAPGQAVPVRISIPKKVRKKYAGKKVKATVTITATDASGNVKKVTRSRSIKLAKLKKKKAKKRG